MLILFCPRKVGEVGEVGYGPAPPNNSFKPNLLRYSKSVAKKACHAFASTTQVGLIQTLCWYWDWWVGCSCCGDISVSDRVGSGVYCFG